MLEYHWKLIAALAILAINNESNIDDAFIRRVRYVVNFL